MRDETEGVWKRGKVNEWGGGRGGEVMMMMVIMKMMIQR